MANKHIHRFIPTLILLWFGYYGYFDKCLQNMSIILKRPAMTCRVQSSVKTSFNQLIYDYILQKIT